MEAFLFPILEFALSNARWPFASLLCAVPIDRLFAKPPQNKRVNISNILNILRGSE
jgi:hypothetical protein